MRRRFAFDMETGDPDDFLTLLLLGDHPSVELVGVTVTPGTPHQVGVVRYGLALLGLDIPVGAFDLDHKKHRGTAEETEVSCVSQWHTATFGAIAPSRDAEPGWRVLEAVFDESTTLVTGAPLKNLGALLAHGKRERFGRLFVQGGFAGEGVVPVADQLPKFRGRRTCPTYNLNGDVRAAQAVLASDRFAERRLIAKNVCHGVIYDAVMHDRVQAVPNPGRGLQHIASAMSRYLHKHPRGKAFHDPLAACCAIDPSIATWAEVEVFRERGEWGANLAPGSDTQIIVAYDHERFVQVLCGAVPGRG